MLLNRWFNRKKAPTSPRARRAMPTLLLLERRDVLSATFLVTTASDSGDGSLRDAIVKANQTPGADFIYFNIGQGIQTITLQSNLPTITERVTIDGYRQEGQTPLNGGRPNQLGVGQGTDANISVELSGAGSVQYGLQIATGNTVVKGLSLYGFSGAGVHVISPNPPNVMILGSFVGLRADGGAPAAKNGVGILVEGNGTFIGGPAIADRNLISANAGPGVLLKGNGNLLRNNLIGVTRLGNGTAFGNGQQGVFVQGDSNFLGGGSPAERNVISGNGSNGVDIFGPNGVQVADNFVLGNYIGTDASGMVAAPNANSGVVVNDAKDTTISNNVISGNNPSKNPARGSIGVGTPGVPGFSSNTLIAGNLIGVAADGVTKLGNGNAGIYIQNSTSATVGGTSAIFRNIIAGNDGDGVLIASGGSGTVVLGNFLGVVGPTGTTALPNAANGVHVTEGASATIGGSQVNAGNVISGNALAGVLVDSLNNMDGKATILGNYIGLGGDGLTSVGNGQQGVFLKGITGGVVGGLDEGGRNVISGNGSHGVEISGGTGAQVHLNLIGTNGAGTAAVGNKGSGVLVNASHDVAVGAPDSGRVNVISGNADAGVVVNDSTNVTIAGNFVGVSLGGSSAVPNQKFGIRVDGTSNNVTIGGTQAAAANVISGNGGDGVYALNGTVLVVGNKIGTNSAGTQALRNNGAGVQADFSSKVTVGGTSAAERNLISGNGEGVALSGSGHKVLGNYIGTDITGTAALGNGSGVTLEQAGDITISGNLISGNVTNGVELADPGVNGNANVTITGNLIGTDKTGTAALPNSNGISLGDASQNVTLGGVGAAGNLISGNRGVGIVLDGSGHKVLGNTIGLDISGAKALPNGGHGILGGNALPLTNTTIGGDTFAAGNIIGGNVGDGIFLKRTGAGVVINGNFIGTDKAGTKAVANAVGITVTTSSAAVTIGGGGFGSNNVISGNKGDGVSVVSGGKAVFAGNFLGLAIDLTPLGNGANGVLLATDGNVLREGNYIGSNADAGVLVTGSGNLIATSFLGNNNTQARPNAIGVHIRGGANNMVSGNVISGNEDDGVLISNSSGNTLKGNLIGLLFDGVTPVANGGHGVHVSGGSGNAIGIQDDNDRNIISGNTLGGVLVENAAATTIRGNYIGTTRDGKTSVGNGTAGVIVSTKATNTTIGGSALRAGNLISGHGLNADGVLVMGDAARTVIQGNVIGLMAGGTGNLGNRNGIVVRDTALQTSIGGSEAGAGNVIGFNKMHGVEVVGMPTATQLQGNRIGLDKSGAIAGNAVVGVFVHGGSGTSVGGDQAGSVNVISGNGMHGVEFNGAAVTGNNIVRGNFIGTDVNGGGPISNGLSGVVADDLTAGKLDIFLNTISGNIQHGVLINHSSNVRVGGVLPGSLNFIGLNKLGTAAVANGGDGVRIIDSMGITVGGANAGNYISGNNGNGVTVGGGSTGTFIFGNDIGLAQDRLTKLANLGHGVHVADSASNTTLGGQVSGNLVVRNAISGNGLHGVLIDAGTTNTTLNANIIGLNASNQNTAVGNGGDGVHVLGKGVKLLGDLTAANFVISGNKGHGVLVSGSAALNAQIFGFRIGTNGAGNAKVGNERDGVRVDGTADVRIGEGLTNGVNRQGNLISGNKGNGIHLVGSVNTLIRGNLVGTALSGMSALGNELAGVLLEDTTNAVIGGAAEPFRNTVSANGQDGIVLSGGSAGTQILFNLVGSGSAGAKAVGNTGNGITVGGTSSNTTATSNHVASNTAIGIAFGEDATMLTLTGNYVGRPTVDTKGNNVGLFLEGQDATVRSNTVFANATTGISVGSTARDISILGNFIGTSSAGSPGVGNGGDGILVTGIATVTIGGTAAGARNIISGNKGNGIQLKNVTDPLVQVVGNRIGVNPAGTAALPNAQDGIQLTGSTNATIQSNVISGNGQNGVELLNGSLKNLIAANKIGVGLNGTAPIPNGGFGVWARQGGGAASSNNSISGNIIGFNRRGVVIGDNRADSSRGNAILANSIFRSSVLIDLGNTGSGSYAPSGSAGPNLLQVPPTLTGATVIGPDLRVTGLLKGTLPNMTFRIEFFAAGPALGNFRQFLGFLMVRTNANGNVMGGFTTLLKGVKVPAGFAVSTTATDANGNTTGFAPQITTSPG